MTPSKVDRIRALLKSIETGDPEPVAFVNEEKYIQHNPQTEEGSEGLAALFLRLSKTSPRVNIVRAFEDGDFVFAHTEYDFSKRNIGFEVFRFEDGRAVEHWDNIQQRLGPNVSGHSMVEGPTEVVDRDLTSRNRSLVSDFVSSVLVGKHLDCLSDYINEASFVEHSPTFSDDLSQLRSALQKASDKEAQIRYDILHRVLAEGNFVLSISEGEREGVHSSFYDLFRIEKSLIVEHWDTTEKIVPRHLWKNDNGKF